MRNELDRETSPYLLQHKDNPVHWLPWGSRAFELAAREDKPIALSVGYAACHWCHVMAHESFEDDETAALMNRNFVCVKVDREERPDVDRIYMDALHALGEQGGWPLTMFLAPDGTPFWGGTYFPPESRYGRPSFKHVLNEISRIWRDERHKVDANASALKETLHLDPSATSGPQLTPEVLDGAAATVFQAMDPVAGGLKGAPKFPQVAIFEFLRRMGLAYGDERYIAAVTTTAKNICQGGIYDHLAGGFARYTVDHRWLVPHFEKMLYDNAQLVTFLTRLWQINREKLFRTRIEETLEWLLSDMRAPDGAFASSYDADSEGEEGRYYVWSVSEINEILTEPDLALFTEVYDVSPGGNWEGHTIFNRLAHQDLLSEEDETRLAAARRRLLERRESRVAPGFDDKVLADWNGLMIAALAEAGLVFERQDWVAEAEAAMAAVLRLLWNGDVLHHSYRVGKTRNLATADGYANLIAAALALFEATGQPRRLEEAEELCGAFIRDYWDEGHGGFYFTSRRTEHLLVRQRHAHDDATPNANGTMMANFARLEVLTGNTDYRRRAEAIHDAFAGAIRKTPFAFASSLSAFFDLTDLVQAVLVGRPEETAALRRAFLGRPVPARLLIPVTDTEALPASHPAAAKAARSSGPALFICRGQNCSLPITDPGAVPQALGPGS
jgi:uncharacterized protein YyaL (SSP411 family)